MKRFLLIIIVVAVIAGVMVFAYRAKDKTAENIPTNSSTVTDTNNVPITSKPFNQKDDDREVEISLPYIEGDQAFNAIVNERIMNGHLEQFQAIEPYEGQIYPYALSVSHAIELETPKLISVRFDIAQDTGGAHGNLVFDTVLYDRAKKRALKLEDVFTGNYAAVLSEKIRAALRHDLETREVFVEEMMLAGTEPRAQSFQFFTLRKNGVAFHYAPYEVAPYAAGTSTVELSYTELKDIIKSDYANP